MDSFNMDGMTYLYPATLEEGLLAIGQKNDAENVEVILTDDLLADLAVRLIRLEDRVIRGE